jgi:hypothetical protein
VREKKMQFHFWKVHFLVNYLHSKLFQPLMRK